VRFQRQRTAETDDSTIVEDVIVDGSTTNRAYTAGKGRPTPKRREAEVRRRGPAAPPPRNQREAAKRARVNKDDRRQAAADRRAGLASGDEKYLMPRDKGPVKEYVRDVVDSRRHLIGLFMPLAVVVLIATVAPVPLLQVFAAPATLVIVLVMLLDGIVLGRTINRRVRVKFPTAKGGGLSLGWYAFSRAMQIRRLRLPKPRLKPGAAV
jgi:hypothetical protein